MSLWSYMLHKGLAVNLITIGVGSCLTLVKLKESAYEIDYFMEFYASTINVAYLSLFDIGTDSRTNPFQEGADDMI